jgi:hypothetical protein
MMTLLKANIKNKKIRFLTKQILRDEIKKKINKKKQCKTKQILNKLGLNST